MNKKTLLSLLTAVGIAVTTSYASAARDVMWVVDEDGNDIIFYYDNTLGNGQRVQRTTMSNVSGHSSGTGVELAYDSDYFDQ